MSTHLYYLFVNLGCIIVPFLFSFHPKLMFYKQWKLFVLGIAAMMAIFIPWDIYFTSTKVWGFNPEYILGCYIGSIPVEEWLFFICIPYACLFTYHCFKVLINNIPATVFLNILVWLSMIACFIIAAMYYDRAY